MFLLLATSAVAGCLGRDDVADRWQGVVEYDERDLAFEVSGRIAEVLVKEGDAVGAGTVLARLDDSLQKTVVAARQSEALAARDQRDLVRAGTRAEDLGAMRARLASARAAESLAQKTVDRTQTLAAGAAVTRATVDEAQAQLERARADRESLEQTLRGLQRGARPQEIEAAGNRLAAAEATLSLERERLARHELRSDRAGEVLQVHLKAGELGPAGVPVMTVADVHQPYADVFVRQADSGRVRLGMPVRARVDALVDEVEGRVERIYRRTEFTPRYIFTSGERGNLVLRVRVRLDDSAGRLHAGLPVFVRVVEGVATSGGRHE